MPWLVVTSHRTVTNVRLTDLLSIGRVPCNNKCGSPKHGANCSGLSKVRRHQRLLNTVFQSRLNYYASASKTSRRAPVHAEPIEMPTIYRPPAVSIPATPFPLGQVSNGLWPLGTSRGRQRGRRRTSQAASAAGRQKYHRADGQDRAKPSFTEFWSRALDPCRRLPSILPLCRRQVPRRTLTEEPLNWGRRRFLSRHLDSALRRSRVFA